MPDHSDVVDSYLAERFKVGLEQVIVDACSGKTDPLLIGVVDATCRERGKFLYQDRGTARHYDGTLTLEGVSYWFRTWIFEDMDGARFMTDLSEFTAIDWKTRLRMGDAG